MALVRMRQTNLETFDGGAADSLLMSGAMSEDQPAQTVGDLQGACEEFVSLFFICPVCLTPPTSFPSTLAANRGQ